MILHEYLDWLVQLVRIFLMVFAMSIFLLGNYLYFGCFLYKKSMQVFVCLFLVSMLRGFRAEHGARIDTKPLIF